VQLAWRVACVRIPRFPIGAVWSEAAGAARRGAGEATSQLDLGLPADPSARDAIGHAGSADWSVGAPPLATRHSALALHWDDQLIALTDGGRLRLVTLAAGRLGVRAGLETSEAETRYPALDVLVWDDAVLDGAITTTTAALLVASPHVTPVAGAPGMWWVAASARGMGGERSLVRTLGRVARLWHPRARVAVASSCVAARAATWGDVEPPRTRMGDLDGDEPADSTPGAAPIPGSVIVPPGRCAAYLAPAPLGFIPMDDDLRAALHTLGLRTVGALAALEGWDVERRWGEEGVMAWRLARGDDWRRPVLGDGAGGATPTVSTELAVPAATVDPLLVLVGAALDRLVRDLAAVGRAPAAVAITLTLDDGRGALPAGSVPRAPARMPTLWRGPTDGAPHTITREVRMARAVDHAGPLFARCRALLERWPLSAPVCGVAVAATATEPLPSTRATAPRPAWPDSDAVDAALERLQAELGAELGPNVVVWRGDRGSGG
jgi:protein ImuB